MKLVELKRNNAPQTYEENLKQEFIKDNKLNLVITNLSAWNLASNATLTAQKIANGKCDLTEQGIIMAVSVALFVTAIGIARYDKNKRNEFINSRKKIEKLRKERDDSKNKEQLAQDKTELEQTKKLRRQQNDEFER